MEVSATGSRIKYLVGSSPGWSGVIAAFIATHIATMAGLWFGAVRLPQFDFNTINGWLVLGFMQAADVTFVIGGVIHYINGLLWGLIFVLLMHSVMGKWVKPLAPLTPAVNLAKGLIWGWALWLISSAVWMPLVVGAIGIPVGPFLTNFGGVGYEAVVTNLLWHTIYGVNLGLIYNPTRGGSA